MSASEGLPRISGWKACGIFLLLTTLFTWPQAIHWQSVPDFMDTYFSMWRIGWIAHQLLADPAHLFDANIFYPVRHTLAYSDAVLLEGVVGAPLIWLGASTVAVYNLLILSAFVASALGAFLLVRDLTGSGDAGVLGGVIFSFAPFRFDHYVHLELLWAQWIPLTLWMLHRTIRSGRWRDGLMTGVCFALQGLSCVYYSVFLATILIVAGPILLTTAAPAVRLRALRSLLAGAVLALIVLVPYARVYESVREAGVGDRGRTNAMLGYSAGPKHYLATPINNILYGSATASISVHEKRLFMGFVVMALVVIGLWPPWNRVRVAYALALAIAIDVSFAQRGFLLGWLWDHVVVYRGLRVPPRFEQIALLSAAVLAGFGLVRVLDWIQARRPRSRRPVLTAIAVLVVVEYLMYPQPLVAVATSPSPASDWLVRQPQAPIINYPMSEIIDPATPPIEPLYQYESTFHWRPMFNGYSGNFPFEYFQTKPVLVTFPADAAIQKLNDLGIQYAIVHERYYDRAVYRAIVTAAGVRRDLVAYGPFADGEFETRIYRILK